MTITRYVGDTSVVVQALVTEANSPRVETLLAGLIVEEPATQLWIPDYCLVECANVLGATSGSKACQPRTRQPIFSGC